MTTFVNSNDARFIASVADSKLQAVMTASVTAYRRGDQLNVGDRMPSLTLTRLADERAVRLDELIGTRPLVLIFGSYTWPPFRRSASELERLYRTHKDRASIFVVYIAEAHAVNEWQTDSNAEAAICIRQHTTFAERLAAARLCEERLSLTIPTLVDGMDNAACEVFAAWPERIYIVGADGHIAFKGGPGPYEFKPEVADEALQNYLSANHANLRK